MASCSGLLGSPPSLGRIDFGKSDQSQQKYFWANIIFLTVKNLRRQRISSHDLGTASQSQYVALRVEVPCGAAIWGPLRRKTKFHVALRIGVPCCAESRSPMWHRELKFNVAPRVKVQCGAASRGPLSLRVEVRCGAVSWGLMWRCELRFNVALWVEVSCGAVSRSPMWRRENWNLIILSFLLQYQPPYY